MRQAAFLFSRWVIGMPRRISDAMGVSKEDLWEQGAFDAFVDIDSRFHIDPHLLEACQTPELQGSYQKFLKHFEDVLRVLAASKQTGDRFHRKAVKMLQFKELPFVSLGYGGSSKSKKKKRRSGNGIGPKLAGMLAETARDLAEAGLRDPVIFELMGLLQEGIGADRISDMTGRIIAEALIIYSVRVAKNLNAPTIPLQYGQKQFAVPYDQQTHRPILLVPREILRPLPIAEDWSDIDTVCAYNKRLREVVNALVGDSWKDARRKLRKKDLKQAVITYPELMRDLLQQYKDKPSDPYDFENDPLGVTVWHDIATEYAEKYPLSLDGVTVVTPEQLQPVIVRICKHFGKLLSKHGLNALLYDDQEKLRQEAFGRMLFFAIADAYCKANNLDINIDHNGGKEALTFRVSRGYKARLQVEVKYSSNGHTLIRYQRAIENYQRGAADAHFFLIIRTKNSKNLVSRLEELQLEEDISKPDLMIIDARLTEQTQWTLWQYGASLNGNKSGEIASSRAVLPDENRQTSEDLSELRKLVEKLHSETRADIKQDFAEKSILIAEHQERNFVRQFRLLQNRELVTCPNFFTIRQKAVNGVIVQNEWYIQLYCQQPGAWHPTGEPYVISEQREIIGKAMPYLKLLLKTLKVVAPLAGVALALADVAGDVDVPMREWADEIKGDFENEVKLMGEFVKATAPLAEIGADDDGALMRSHSSRREFEPVGAADLAPVRQLMDILAAQDAAAGKPKWRGLKRAFTPEGDILWLDEAHLQTYLSQRKRPEDVQVG